jgi:hypothetical protein
MLSGAAHGPVGRVDLFPYIWAMGSGPSWSPPGTSPGCANSRNATGDRPYRRPGQEFGESPVPRNRNAGFGRRLWEPTGWRHRPAPQPTSQESTPASARLPSHRACPAWALWLGAIVRE